MKTLTAILFLATIPLANWLIGNVGLKCIPDGPCLIPVYPGIWAPSGVIVVGFAFVLRDAVHERGGVWLVLPLIAAGAALSNIFAPPALAIASGLAFGLSELADMLVYAPLRKRSLAWAVAASGVVGAVVDSALFLWLAFGSLEYMQGQVMGKMLALFVVLPWLAWRRAT